MTARNEALTALVEQYGNGGAADTVMPDLVALLVTVWARFQRAGAALAGGDPDEAAEAVSDAHDAVNAIEARCLRALDDLGRVMTAHQGAISGPEAGRLAGRLADVFGLSPETAFSVIAGHESE